MTIRMYDRVTQERTGRTGIALRDERRSANVPVVWVAWDDAETYPRYVRCAALTVTGHASREDVVVYAPGTEHHGKRIGELPTS